jgi:uncharacterized protein
MANAFLTLYAVTGERAWLERARSAASYMDAHFRSDTGFSTSVLSNSVAPTRQLDENVVVARFSNLLNQYTGDSRFRDMAEHAMRYLVSQGEVRRRGYQVAGMLLADQELSMAPLHITVVGSKGDPAARALYLAALKQPTTYKRVEWFDEAEGPLPHADVEYPRIGKAAAFLCTEKSCSAPIFTPEKLKAR